MPTYTATVNGRFYSASVPFRSTAREHSSLRAAHFFAFRYIAQHVRAAEQTRIDVAVYDARTGEEFKYTFWPSWKAALSRRDPAKRLYGVYPCTPAWERVEGVKAWETHAPTDDAAARAFFAAHPGAERCAVWDGCNADPYLAVRSAQEVP